MRACLRATTARRQTTPSTTRGSTTPSRPASRRTKACLRRRPWSRRSSTRRLLRTRSRRTRRTSPLRRSRSASTCSTRPTSCAASLTRRRCPSARRRRPDSPTAAATRTPLRSRWCWAETMQQKQFLCRGCYDPYCDAESKAAVRAMDCHLDSESHQSDAVKFIDGWTALALLETARDGVADNVNVVVMVCALLMLFAAKWSLDRGEHSKNAQVFNAVREDSAYGSVSAV